MNLSEHSYVNIKKSPKDIKEAILYKLIFVLGVDPKAARPRHWLNAAVYVARDLLTEGWIKYRRENFDNKERHIYYLSMEYLIGRTFINSLINNQCLDEFKQAFKDLGLDFDYIVGEEDDPGLGNGGLGRLAACFMDSLATLKIPSVGYGIRYQYGMFYQEIKDGKQVEKPDLWLEKDMSWQFLRTSKRYPVFFGGTVRQGIFGDEWYPAEKLTAICYDDIIPAWGGDSCNTLRLWSAHAGDDFNLSAFNKGDYYSAMEAQTKIENISRVLYPDDSTDSGRELRLRQEYFLVAASIHDIISRHKRMGNTIESLPEKVAIHLNDTHPVLAIPELMRVLVHIEGVKWEKAWEMCKKIFSYTNHTLMSEALETWPVEMMQRVLPLHLNIIYGINNQFLDEVRRKGFDSDFISKVSLIDESGNRRVRMAWLAVVASHKVNGVAKIHSDLMVSSIFAPFAKIWPEKFTNVTNGVTPRRWLMIANPELSKLLDEKIGKDWKVKLEKLTDLNKFKDDKKVLARLGEIKFANKKKLADYLREWHNVDVSPDALFDVQIKRIHEYKRQSLNILHIVHRYLKILANPDAGWQPRVHIFAGKAASAYNVAKKTIEMINAVANVINNDKRVKGLIKVVFIPNYSVSLAEMIIPAAELSEQISLAGTEASGTSNMKFALNGALTIGTLDGANVEIKEKVGDKNIFIFGNTVEQVEALRAKGYDPMQFIEANEDLRAVIRAITTGMFSPDDPSRFGDVFQVFSDYYQMMADFTSYVETQMKVDEFYKNKEEWAKASLANIANMGYFSSDRSIIDYAEKIWNVVPKNS